KGVDGETVGTQKMWLTDYLGDDDLPEPQRVYLDDGVSALTPFAERPEGAQLLADAPAGKFDVLLVRDPSPIGRSGRLVLDFVQAMIACGVEVMCGVGRSGDVITMAHLRLQAMTADVEEGRTR